jgi:DNA-directed RNA polymerase subunit RPC12/RpoP
VSTFAELKQVVRQISGEAQQNRLNLRRQLKEVQTWPQQIKAEIDPADEVLKRLGKFPMKAGSEYLCPRCWAAEKKISPLKYHSSAAGDVMSCSACRFELLVARKNEALESG